MESVATWIISAKKADFKKKEQNRNLFILMPRLTTTVNGMRPCVKCKETKPVSEFHRRGNTFKSECKPCTSIISKKRMDRIKQDPELYHVYRKNQAKHKRRRRLRIAIEKHAAWNAAKQKALRSLIQDTSTKVFRDSSLKEQTKSYEKVIWWPTLNTRSQDCLLKSLKTWRFLRMKN